MSIFVTRSSMPSFEEYIEEIRPIFESRILTNMGPIYKKFQHQMLEYLDVPYLSLFVNGHMALEMAIQAMGLNQPGGEVITTPFTFVSTTHSIVRNGLTPVFCDIRESDFTMDPEKIEALITDKTVAIMPVHVYGNICDVEKIDEIGKKHGIKVIYDAAHALGVKYKGVGIANYGDASMFSFHATKVFHTIEGGAIAFKDAAYREKLHILKNFGLSSPEDVTEFGGNAKMDEFRAAMGICNLRRLNESIKSRETAYKRYIERIGNVPGIYIPAAQQDVEANYAYMPAVFDEKILGKTRDQVAEALKENDIFARKYFYPAINDMTCYRNVYGESTTPIAHGISLRVLTLPLFEGLSEEDVDRICDIILK
ncbi:MAG: DegT/DnrJ/EryC1/StrS family aminotransferase [Clostridia bacterium]|nr:DegT/DnrJ/EryC1/StrS family aminotransferase [Clostridia bacterium]